MNADFKALQMVKKKQDDIDGEEEEKELAKIKQKEDMEKAAKYVQERWVWFQDEGRALAKKRKRGGKGGKKGKKKK